MFCYKVNFWDNFDGINKDITGLISAADYGEAANKIINYYGKENVIQMKLRAVSSVLEQDEITPLLEEF